MLFRGPQLKVRILRRHFDKSTGFGEISLDEAFQDVHGCPIAEAMKEKFPESEITVGGFDVTIDGEEYAFADGGQYVKIMMNKPFTLTLKKGK